MQQESEPTPASALGRLFTAVEKKLADGRVAHRRQCRDFFHQLEPRLAAARELDRKLNHHLAHRFNVFRYLRDDEFGLSRVIADLLNPRAAHGQGPLFLRLLLHGLKVNPGLSDENFREAKVSVERSIEKNRRIDIYVEFPSCERPYGLAIENKPYAADQSAQVKDYLDHLKGRFDADRFHLIYLSPTGQLPDEASLPETEYEQWRNHLIVMPYHDRLVDEGRADDEGSRDEFRAFYSLAQWLADCRAKCETQRLRWFLGDAESYCRRTFGDIDMAIDFETKAVLELLKSNSGHLETAWIVHKSWPKVRDWICERFQDHLRKCIVNDEELKKLAPDIQVDTTYVGEKRYQNGLDLYRRSWSPYENKDPTVGPRTSHIRLQAEGKGPWNWVYGVRSPLDVNKMSKQEKARRKVLEGKLKSGPTQFSTAEFWPAYRNCADEWKDWDGLAVELDRELSEKGGEITNYYVRTLIDFAQVAIPIINEIEGSKHVQG